LGKNGILCACFASGLALLVDGKYFWALMKPTSWVFQRWLKD
jgi:hypothetical protein